MKLTYIYHSGFMIESSDCLIIMDYYKDSEKVVQMKLDGYTGKVYVLSSHSHHDHFNPEILKWERENPNINYIFSRDIQDVLTTAGHDITYLDKGGAYSDGCIEIKAFGSTDLGISFLMRFGGKTIFHAGDLNNWHWNEESTAEEIAEAENAYLIELIELAKEVTHLDLVMFPVDPRLGKDYMKGAQQFVDAIKTDIFAPMHFDEDYSKASAFAEYVMKHNTKFFFITHKGQNLEF